MAIDLPRLFIKQRLERGTGERAARESYNALVGLSPDQIESRWGRAWGRLSGKPTMTPKESHRIYSSLGRKARSERTNARQTFRLRTEAERTIARNNGLPEPSLNYQKAHDAGSLYRATHDERYREDFEEGSP